MGAYVLPHLNVIFTNCGSTGLCDGFPFWSIPEAHSIEKVRAVENLLPPSLGYLCRIHKILTSGISAITKTVDLERHDIGDALNSLIDIFDAQLQEVVAADFSNLCKYT